MKLKEFMGWEIQVGEDGRFFATDGRQRLSRKELSALEREIANRSTARVEVMHPPSRAHSPTAIPRKVVLVRLEPAGRARSEEGELLAQFGWAAYDQEVVDAIAAFIAQRTAVLKALEAEYRAWRESVQIAEIRREDLERLFAKGTPQKGDEGA